MKIKILFVLGLMGTNGVTKSLISLLDALSKEKYEVSLFLFVHDSRYIRLIPSHVKILPPIPEYEMRAMSLKKAFVKAFKMGRFDLLYSRVLSGYRRRMNCGRPTRWEYLPDVVGDWDIVCSYADGWLSSMVINKIPEGKKVLWVHEDYSQNCKPQSVLDSFRSADAIVGVSQTAVNSLIAILGEGIRNKTYVVHNIIDPDEVIKASQEGDVVLPGKQYNIMSVGRISQEKGYDMVPAIMEILVRGGIDVHWSIMGSGSAAARHDIVMDARRRGVYSRIHFLGEKTNPHPYTKAADCFVQLSYHEGWCMTISEALSLGKPVVVSDLPVFHEQVFEGENGYFAHDVDSFAESIQRVLTHGVASPRHRPLPFTPEHVKMEFDEVIKSLG